MFNKISFYSLKVIEIRQNHWPSPKPTMLVHASWILSVSVPLPTKMEGDFSNWIRALWTAKWPHECVSSEHWPCTPSLNQAKTREKLASVLEVLTNNYTESKPGFWYIVLTYAKQSCSWFFHFPFFFTASERRFCWKILNNEALCSTDTDKKRLGMKEHLAVFYTHIGNLESAS